MKSEEFQLREFTCDNETIHNIFPDDSIDLERSYDIQKRDKRGFSFLMFAAESGKSETVNLLIEKGEDLDFEVEGQTAASLAFTNGHHEIVLSLIKSNAKFPNNYNHETASNELKAFVNLSQEMHEKVRNCNQENEESLESVKGLIKENCERFPALRYFYDTSNNSLLKTSIIRKMFEIYKLLLSLNIFLGEHESVDDIMTQLTSQQQKKLRNINEELSTNIFTDEMMILMRNCKLGPGVTDHGFYIEFIRKAFDFLFKVNPVAIILKVVAARREFKIIFDFKRDSVQFLVPSSEPYTNGLCYLNGKIYVAARDMLDPKNAHKVYAVMAHELCHFAMFLVYENSAKPYRKNNVSVKREFNQIIEACEALYHEEEIISSVFEEYPEEMQHAELIVRIPQMLVTYFHDKEVFTQNRENFSQLYDFYETNVMSEMEEALPKLKKQFRRNKEFEKLKRWIYLLIAFFIISISLCVVPLFYVHKPNYLWSNLSNWGKSIFKNTTVNFYGADVKFGELFANDSEVYNLLSSEQIKYGIEGNSSAVTKAINSYFYHEIYLTYQNMSNVLKNNLKMKIINFQGKEVKIQEILKNFTVLNNLNSSQIMEIFRSHPIKILCPTELNVKFYVERSLVKRYKNYDVDAIIYELLNKTEKVFLISSQAGEGKSTLMRYLSVSIKDQLPKNWVQFIDLKKYADAYKRGSEINLTTPIEILKFFSFDILKLNDLESEIFQELYNESRVIFLFDGIDEILPLYKDLMLNLTLTIKKTSNCTQFISTRPQFSNEFSRKLEVDIFELSPIDEISRLEFIMKTIAIEKFHMNGDDIWFEFLISSNKYAQNFLDEELFQSDFAHSEQNKKLLSLISKALKILRVIDKNSDQKFSFHPKKNEQTVTNPLLLRMISEILIDENFNEKSDLNFYSIYDEFINKKLKIVRNEKGEIVGKDSDKILKSSNVNIMQVHQAYALLLIFDSKLTSNLSIISALDKLSNSEISRFGILDVTSENFHFAHRTFAEFFVARFLIDNFENLNIKRHDVDLEEKFHLLNLVSLDVKFEFIENFLLHYQKLESKPLTFLESLRTKEVFSKELYEEIQKFSSIAFLELFLKDQSKKDQKINLLKMYPELNKKIVDDLADRLIMEKFCDVWIISVNDKKNEDFIQILERKYSDPELKKFISDPQKNTNETLLMIAVNKMGYKEIKILWNFIEKHLNQSDIKELLLRKSHLNWTALKYAEKRPYPRPLSVINALYDKFLTKEEKLNAFMSANDNENFNFFGLVFNLDSSVDWYIKYLKEVFGNEKRKLRQFLARQNSNGESIFSYFKGKPKYQEKINVFIQLLRGTFKANEEEEFKNFLTTLELKFKVFSINAETFDEESLRRLFLAKDDKNSTFLQELILLKNENFSNFYLDKISEILNKTEIVNLIFTQGGEAYESFLMNAASEKQLHELKSFWNFTEKYLKEEEKRKFLLLEDKNYWTAFQHAAWNRNLSSFLFVKEIYEKFFTQEKIREILTKTHKDENSFIYYVITNSSPETSKVVSLYLEGLFRDQKIELRKILTHRDANGNTVYRWLENFSWSKDKYKIFVELLRKTFDEISDENFKSYLKSLLSKV